MNAAADPDADPANARLTVDLDALAANYAALNALGPAEVGPVVKADAYGLGAGPVARRLWAEGARRFFVARIVEGERLRTVLPQPEATIYVFDGCPQGQAARLRASALTPVVNSPEQAQDWIAAGGGKAALMLDTGLNRLGFTAADAAALASDAAWLGTAEVELVVSHLACADQPAHPMNPMQRDRFDVLARLFPKARRSLAASDGLFLGPAFAFDLARTGVCLYGGGPEGRPDPRIRPVATFEAPILQVRTLERGDTAGYGAAFIAERPMRVAVVAAGYADGVLRAAHPKAYGSIGGARARVIGRISMDLTLFDVTDLPEARADVGVGAMMQIIGPDALLDDVAKASGTIAYELLTRLGGRATRVYKGAP